LPDPLPKDQTLRFEGVCIGLKWELDKGR